MAAGVDLDGLVLRRHAAVLVGDDGLLQLLPPARPALRRHRRPREVRQQVGLDRQRRREGGAGGGGGRAGARTAKLGAELPEPPRVGHL